MALGFSPKDASTQSQALKVQELTVSGADPQLFTISGGNLFVLVREPVDKVYLATCKVDSTNLVTQFAQASISIVDSSTLTASASSNRGAIELVGLTALAANDVITIRYAVLEHL